MGEELEEFEFRDWEIMDDHSPEWWTCGCETVEYLLRQATDAA
uniref:Uncharacterized protein n=1 Tax=Setaria digitata TaxID=48799 RepID=A0A915PZP8_9BILA